MLLLCGFKEFITCITIWYTIVLIDKNVSIVKILFYILIKFDYYLPNENNDIFIDSFYS